MGTIGIPSQVRQLHMTYTHLGTWVVPNLVFGVGSCLAYAHTISHAPALIQYICCIVGIIYQGKFHHFKLTRFSSGKKFSVCYSRMGFIEPYLLTISRHWLLVTKTAKIFPDK